MTIDYFTEFLSLAETQNFSVTAARHYISIATLSRHIHAIEEEYGTILFRRIGQKVQLTDAGKKLVPYAESIVESHAEYRAIVAPIRETPDLTISVASTVPLSFYGITELITRFQKSHTINQINVQQVSSSDIEGVLRSDANDFCIISHIDNLPYRYSAIPLKKIQFCALVPTNHVFASRNLIMISDLKNEPLILFDNTMPFHSQAIQLCTAAGFIPKISVTAHRGRTIEKLAAEGFGIGLLPVDAITNLHYSVVRKLIIPNHEIALDIVYNSSIEPSVCANSLMQYLHDAFNK